MQKQVIDGMCGEAGHYWASAQKQGIAVQGCRERGIAEQARRSWILLGKCAEVGNFCDECAEEGHCWVSVQKQGTAAQGC